MKILIDTNIFLDFYRTNSHPVNIFNALKENIESIVITEQIIQEFERSRENVLLSVRQKFQQESTIEDFSSSYLQNLEEFKNLVTIQKNYRQIQKDILTKFNEIIDDPSLDPIYNYFSEFVNLAVVKNIILPTTNEIIAKAEKRKKIGNPPVSDKYSIGDEINWEVVLENITDDLVIVGRDNTFTRNINFLKKDFHKRTGKIIVNVTKSIAESLEIIGIQASIDLKDEEKATLKVLEKENYNDYWKQKD